MGADSAAPKLGYVPTGVAGLDRILFGGFLEHGFYLLQGDPGSGKTTVALQFLLAGERLGRRGMYVTLTETRGDIERTCASHGWDCRAIEISDLTQTQATAAAETQYTIFQPSEVELGEVTAQIFAEVERVRPRSVVLDGLAELRLLAGDALRYRRQLLALKHFFDERRITVLLLDDRTSPIGHLDPESLVSGNVVMDRFLPGYGGARRRLYVTKVRGGQFRSGYHDYDILAGGVIVHPRLVAGEHHAAFEPEMYSSGIEHLDRMLHGGLQSGTTTVLLGPAGVGKSTVSMQFVASALVRGTRAAVFSFDEVLDTVFARSEKLCRHDLREYARNGTLHAQQVNPAELSPGAFAAKVSEVVDAGARMIVIDSLNGYLSAMPDERFLTTHLHELFAYLNQKGVATICVVAQHGLLLANSAELDISYIADSVLLLRYFEAGAQIRQLIGVFKKRTGPHERTLRELTISSTGVRVGQPLEGFRAIMSGVPKYEGSTAMLQDDDEGSSN